MTLQEMATILNGVQCALLRYPETPKYIVSALREIELELRERVVLGEDSE